MIFFLLSVGPVTSTAIAFSRGDDSSMKKVRNSTVAAWPMKMNAFCEPDNRNSLRRNAGCTIWTRITPRGAVLPPTASVAVCSSAVAAFCTCDSESLF